MAKLLMNILFLLLLLYPVSLHGNAHDRGEAELTQNDTDPLHTTRPIPTRFPLVMTPSNETINLPPITMSNTTTNFDNDTDATKTTTNLLATNNTDTTATKSSTALATNSTNNTDDTTDSNATNATDTNIKDAIATTTNTTVTNTTANGTTNSNTKVNATSTDTTTNITERIAKLSNKINTNSRRTMVDTTSTNATIITDATDSRNNDATIATNSSTNNTSDISTTDTNNASNITNTDTNNTKNVDANNNTNVTTNITTFTTSTNAISTNNTETISHTNRMECENEPIEANLTTNETTECFSHILSEDYIKEKEGIYIERADVYRISKVYDPCVEGHRRIRPLIIVAVVVTLHSGHPFRLKGEQLVMRVYQEEDECKLLFRRLTCVPPEWFRLLGRYAPEPGKKFGQLVEWRKLVNEKHMTRPMKICDDEFERLVLPDVGNWGKPMFFKRSSENGH